MKKTTIKRPAKAAQSARATSKKAASKKLTTSTLRVLNLVFAVLLSAQAVALVLLADKAKGTVPIKVNYLTRDAVSSEVAGKTVLAQATDTLFNINLAYVAAATLLIGALVSLLLATRYRRGYEAELQTGSNKFRWISYVLYLGLVLVTGALLVGVYDAAALAMIFVLTAVFCVTALQAERRRARGAEGWLPGLAVTSFIVPVAVIAFYVLMGHIYGGGLPFETLIATGVLGLGLLLAALAFNNTYKANNKPNQYLAVERTYLVFGFLVPSAFAWAIFSMLLK